MINTLKNMLFKAYIQVVKGISKLILAPKPLTLVGEGSVLKLGEMFSGSGWKKPLVMTDDILLEIGVADSLKQSLENAGIDYVIFDGVLPDPTYNIVNSALDMVKNHDCDSVIALGGGSAIDAAKVVQLAATNNKDPRKLAGMFKAGKPGLPFVAIPTTAGTGSEVTMAAVISESDSHKKTMVIDTKTVPDIAILDPQLHIKLPPAITAATAMDALTHGVEAYLSTYKTKETDAYALRAIKMILSNIEEAYQNGSNVVAREQLLLASYYAGLAFNRASLGYVHAIAHQLGAKYQVPHGIANSMVLAYVTEFNSVSRQNLLAELALETGLGSASEGDSALAKNFIDKIRQLAVALHLPATIEGLKEGDINELAKAAIKEAQVTPYPVPRIMSLDECENIIRKLLP